MLQTIEELRRARGKENPDTILKMYLSKVKTHVFIYSDVHIAIRRRYIYLNVIMITCIINVRRIYL